MTPHTTEELRRIRRSIWYRDNTMNILATVPVASWYLLAARHFNLTASYTSWFVLSLPAIILVPAYLYRRWHGDALFRPIAEWAATDREPTLREREQVIDHPRRIMIDTFAFWIWGLLWAMVSGVVNFDGLEWQLARVAAAQLMSAIIASALVYLATEDAIRPLYARAVDSSVQRRTIVGVGSRFILVWIVGAATYFIAIALIADALPSGTAGPYILGACAFALVVGAFVTVAGARSVARPLDTVSAALARVERGDLDASVPVDDAGEVGRLQAGFNRMVTGLRERDRLEGLLARHVGSDVARRAIDATGLAGVQVEASVMFVDIIGSTALAAERPPESVVAMINAFFADVIRVVTDAGGLVNQLQGDGALCIFGAPVEVPDHAARALRAAVALRAGIVALGDIYPGFDAAIGVSTGRVVAGDVGTEDRSEYTVIGDAANEASRLTDAAKGRASRLLVSEQTVRAAGSDAGDWLSIGSLDLRGRPTPTEAFEPA